MSPILLKDAHARNLEIKEIVLLSADQTSLYLNYVAVEDTIADQNG
jgi:hypothetical protein